MTLQNLYLAGFAVRTFWSIWHENNSCDLTSFIDMKKTACQCVSTSQLCACMATHFKIWQQQAHLIPWSHFDLRCIFLDFVSGYFLLYAKSWNTIGSNYCPKKELKLEVAEACVGDRAITQKFFVWTLKGHFFPSMNVRNCGLFSSGRE